MCARMPLAGQGDEVRARAIFAIGHHRPRFARRVRLVLGEQVTQFRSVIADGVGRRDRGDDSYLVIQCPVTSYNWADSSRCLSAGPARSPDRSSPGASD